MKKRDERQIEAGFSILEMIVAMTIVLIVVGLVSTLFARSLSTRQRESSRTDGLTATQAALNVISREMADSGYGLKIASNGMADNGMIVTDSNQTQAHFRANVENSNITLTDPGEDVTYYFEPTTQSILRYDKNGNGPGVPQTSTVINRISRLTFQYFDYSGSNPVPTVNNVPSANTGRVRITVRVIMEGIVGQVNPNDVVLVSDVTLRNSDYMLQQY